MFPEGGPIAERVSGTTLGGTSLKLVAHEPTDPSDTTEFEFRQTTADTAGVKPVGAPFDAWLFRRHGGTETPAGGDRLERGTIVVGPDEAPHAEMADSGALRAAEDFRLAALVFSMAASPVSTCWHTHSRSSRSREETGARHGSPRRVSIDICTPSGSRKSPGPSSQAVPLTQEPYDRTLVSDMLRRELGVPAMDEQQKQMDALLGKRGKVAPTPDRVP